MDSDLKSLFCSYVDIVRKTIQPQYAREEAQRSEGLVILSNKVLELQALVDELENSELFNRLVRKTVASFPQNPHFGYASAARAVGHFFRRSRCYIDVFKNHVTDPEALFQTYEHACQRQERQVTYLVPLEGVGFSEPRMDFGRFEIQLFRLRQLNELLRNDVNEYFYHDAIIDVTRLICFFICCRATENLSDIYRYIDNFYEELLHPHPIAESYTHYPKNIEEIITILSLYDWNIDHDKRTREIVLLSNMPSGYRNRLYVPFYIKLTDDLLDGPEKTPDFSKLVDIEEYFHDETGEKIGEGPTIYNEFDVDMTKHFKSFVGHITSLFENIFEKQDQCRFFDIAKGYFVKACFEMNLLDELLYYIIALEALFGEREKGISVRLSTRLALVLGKNQNERNMIHGNFGRLYCFRCDIVHGGHIQAPMYEGHVRQAHEFVRRALIWFLQYLNDAAACGSIPAREWLLKKLDVAQHPGVRLQDVPPGFPRVQEWMKWIE